VKRCAPGRDVGADFLPGALKFGDVAMRITLKYAGTASNRFFPQAYAPPFTWLVVK
jgi:hypothetical protein